MQNISEYKCEICGLLSHKQIYHCNEKLWLCPSCSEQLYSCRGCTRRANCEREQNPLNISPVIVQTISQGGMTIRKQIVNPELVQAYCRKCECGFEQGELIGCMREACGRCDKWQLHEEYRKEKE